jgi:hypothetical protein
VAHHDLSDAQLEDLWNEFHSSVNMTSRELQDWLNVLSVDPGAFPGAGDEVVSPESGARIAAVLTKRRTDVTQEDVNLMVQIVDLVARENPDPDGSDIQDDAWRRRLMTVGHDPLKATR